MVVWILIDGDWFANLIIFCGSTVGIAGALDERCGLLDRNRERRPLI